MKAGDRAYRYKRGPTVRSGQDREWSVLTEEASSSKLSVGSSRGTPFIIVQIRCVSFRCVEGEGNVECTPFQ